MPKRFGIVSGAGPMAGALLYSRVIELLQYNGAWLDADFPTIILVNVPFSDMLTAQNEHSQVREELIVALNCLSPQVDYVYIACQTLHIFLSEEEMARYKVVSLLRLLKDAVMNEVKPILVAASNTSRRLDLHGQSIPALLDYINPKDCDQAINTVLKGQKPELSWLIEKSFNNRVVLGCTEFSVACKDMRFEWIDPIQLAALDMVSKFLSPDS